jgi:hypothetical protein
MKRRNATMIPKLKLSICIVRPKIMSVPISEKAILKRRAILFVPLI